MNMISATASTSAWATTGITTRASFTIPGCASPWTDKIEPWLRSHGLFDEEHEEIYISDYDALPFRCPEVFDEYAHLDELNVLAMQLALLPDGALEHIDAAANTASR